MRCSLVIMATLLMLAGCGQGEDDAKAPASPPSEVQPETADPDTAFPEAYRPYRAAARDYAQSSDGQGFHFDPARSAAGDGPPVIEAVICVTPGGLESVGQLPAREARMKAVSVASALFAAALGRAGYPDALYQERIADFEREVLGPVLASADPAWERFVAYQDLTAEMQRVEDLQNTAFAKMTEDIEAVRSRTRPDLPQIVPGGECGAGESPAIVRSTPAGGRVWLISRFDFLLCNARRFDAWDRSRCLRWAEIGPVDERYLSGTYMYQARWPDGGAGRGDVTIPVGVEEDVPVIVEVKRQ